MHTIVKKYKNVPRHSLDYTTLLVETNIFGQGKDLIYDPQACQEIITILSEVEACLDLQAAFQVLTEKSVNLESMKVSSELEFWSFFEKGDFSKVLFIGCGAYPTTAFYLLAQLPNISVDGIDLVPHCSVLSLKVAALLGFGERFNSFSGNALDLDQEKIRQYDRFFVASALRPKNDLIKQVLLHKSPHARIYAREDEAHPYFYELVTIDHPDLLSARQARACWLKEKGERFPLPKGCEVFASK